MSAAQRFIPEKHFLFAFGVLPQVRALLLPVPLARFVSTTCAVLICR
ncbi:hypothetical protein [Achromobacter spanius]